MSFTLKQIKRFGAFSLLLSAAIQTGCIAQTGGNDKSSESEAQISTKKNADSGKKNAVTTRSASDSSPKNVIVFIGDGMGISTLTAGRIFVGQQMGKTGEEHELSWDRFDHLALIKTYNTNAQVPDSAGTATAILSGYKTNIGAVNVLPDPDVAAMIANGCGSANPPTLTDKAKTAGKAVGVVSTARLTHATPAAMYSHSASRDIEADKDLDPPFDVQICKSISQQLIESEVDLALGGGSQGIYRRPDRSLARHLCDNTGRDDGLRLRRTSARPVSSVAYVVRGGPCGLGRTLDRRNDDIRDGPSLRQ